MSPEPPLKAAAFRPAQRLDRVLRPFQEFIEVEASGGILLLLALILALLAANTSLSPWYQSFWQQQIVIGLGGFVVEESLQSFINDGLMTLFFFVSGLEIKRAFVLGELRSWRRAGLPLSAALFGLLLPIGLYLLIAGRGPARDGWAIPVATDIALMVGFLSLLGRRVPQSLKVFLLSVAIFDNLAASVLIGLVYASDLSLFHLLLATLSYAGIFVLQLLGVRRLGIYALLGVLLWFYLDRSGVQPTVAGVLLALATPSTRLLPTHRLAEFLQRFLRHDVATGPERMALIQVAREAHSPLERIHHELHPWVALAVVPLFALANAGIPVQGSLLGGELTLAILAGLLFAKPLGLFLGAQLYLLLKPSARPEDWNAKILLGASVLSGVGLTLSIFFAGLAFEGPQLQSARLSILIASAGAAILGLGILHRVLDRRESGFEV